MNPGNLVEDLGIKKNPSKFQYNVSPHLMLMLIYKL